MLLLLLACQAPEVDDDSPGSPADTGPCEPNTWGQGEVVVAMENILAGTTDDCEKGWYTSILDGLLQMANPWYEDVYVTTSNDGATIDLGTPSLVRAHAAVPEAVVGDDGRTYLYFVEGDVERGKTLVADDSDWMATHGLVGFGAFDAMVSDNGVDFEPLEDFAIEGIVLGMVVDPEVIRLPDGRWRLYYIGTDLEALFVPGAWADGTDHTLYFAESDDLIHWTQVGPAVFGPNADPAVWCRSDLDCVLVSTGIDWSSSSDGGVTFSFDEREEPAGFAPTFVELPDGAVRLFYNAKIVGGPIWSQVTYNGGSTWSEGEEVLPPDTIEALSFAAATEGWQVFYHVWQEGHDPNSWD